MSLERGFVLVNLGLLLLISFFLFAATVRLQPTSPSKQDVTPRLSSHRTLSILVLSDLHLGEAESTFGPSQDAHTYHHVRSLLDHESPELAVLNGDLLTGEDTYEANATEYIHRLVQPLEEKKIAWASTYGNHDSAFNLDRKAIVKAEREHALALTRWGWPGAEGMSNYYVVIRDAKGKSALILYFLDSQGGYEFHNGTRKKGKPSRPLKGTNSTLMVAGNSTGVAMGNNRTVAVVTNSTTGPETDENHEIPGVVGNKTVSWLLKTHEELTEKYGRVLPSLLFVHIPPTLFAQVQTEQSFLPRHFPGLDADAPLSTQGSNGHGLNDAKFVKAVMGLEGLHSIYSGHDHGASWCGVAEGRKPEGRRFLCFGRHTGQGGYGNWTRGARGLKVVVPEEGTQVEVETWVRLIDGRVISRVGLNETYGKDDYPEEDVD